MPASLSLSILAHALLSTAVSARSAAATAAIRACCAANAPRLSLYFKTLYKGWYKTPPPASLSVAGVVAEIEASAIQLAPAPVGADEWDTQRWLFKATRDAVRQHAPPQEEGSEWTKARLVEVFDNHEADWRTLIAGAGIAKSLESESYHLAQGAVGRSYRDAQLKKPKVHPYMWVHTVVTKCVALLPGLDRQEGALRFAAKAAGHGLSVIDTCWKRFRNTLGSLAYRYSPPPAGTQPAVADCWTSFLIVSDAFDRNQHIWKSQCQKKSVSPADVDAILARARDEIEASCLRFNRSNKPVPWIAQIIENTIAAYFRKRNAPGGLVLEFEQDIVDGIQGGYNPDEDAGSDSEGEHIRRAAARSAKLDEFLAHLPRIEREIVIQRKLEEPAVPYPPIAIEFSINETAARALAKKAGERLRAACAVIRHASTAEGLNKLQDACKQLCAADKNATELFVKGKTILEAATNVPSNDNFRRTRLNAWVRLFAHVTFSEMMMSTSNGLELTEASTILDPPSGLPFADYRSLTPRQLQDRSGLIVSVLEHRENFEKYILWRLGYLDEDFPEPLVRAMAAFLVDADKLEKNKINAKTVGKAIVDYGIDGVPMPTTIGADWGQVTRSLIGWTRLFKFEPTIRLRVAWIDGRETEVWEELSQVSKEFLPFFKAVVCNGASYHTAILSLSGVGGDDPFDHLVRQQMPFRWL